MAATLPSPADETQPFILTDEQARLIVAWYALDDRGDFIYRRAICEMAKGWGKSPLWGSVALMELAGHVVFDGWDADGNPVGRPWGTGDAPPAWVQIAAVSEDQTDNTYGAMYELLMANGGRAADLLKIDAGRTRLYLTDRPGKLEPVTAAAGSREGQRVTFSVLDETHLWLPSNGGVKLASTVRRNAAKMGGRTVETTNAPRLGERSVAERSGSDVQRGFSGILHYNRQPAHEPQPDDSDDKLLEALEAAYGDAHWIDRQRILKEIRDPSTDWDDALRFFFNCRVAGTGRAVDPRRWDELAQPRDVPSGTYLGLGFDGSVSQDATVLRACLPDGYSFILGYWLRPQGQEDWTVPRLEVHEAVQAAFARYRVGRMFCDPPLWRTEIEQWAAKYDRGDRPEDKVVLAFDTNQARRFAPAVDRWRTAIREGTHTHDGDSVTDDHVKAVHLKKVQVAAAEDDGRTKYVLVKGEDRRKIDAAIADVLAHEAAMTMPADPGPPKPRRMVSF
jgi:hypothetical protein